MIDRMELEPVLVRALLAIAALLISFGVEIEQDWIDLAVELVAIGFSVWAAFDARKRVTPLARPQDDTGRNLVPEQG